MNFYNNLKISTKLITAFVLVSLIAGIIGVIGYTNVNTLGNQDIPSIDTIHVIKEEMTEISSLSNTLLSPKLTLENKTDLYNEIENYNTLLNNSIATYDGMKKSDAEETLWQEAKILILQWQEGQNDFINISKSITEKGIDDPAEVRYQIGLKQRDHLSWIYTLTENIRGGVQFTGQLDGSQCALGLWLESYESRNETFNEYMIEIEENHLKVHNSGSDINDILSKNSSTKIDDAYTIFDRETNVAMDAVLATLVAMDDIAKVSDDLFIEMVNMSLEVNQPDFTSAAGKIDEAIAKVTSESKSSVTSSSLMILIFSIIGVVISILLGLFMSRIITKPIKEVVEIANEVASGNLDVRVSVKSEDETGQLSRAFSIMTSKVNDVMVSINAASSQVAAGSRQVSDSSMSLSQGATEQASSIQELTASIEEISSQTRQNATNAIDAKEMTGVAREYAETGNNEMTGMLQAMSEINDSSKSISKIIKVIDDIAFQTNILALNAAVEAARAGQHGKGFAVVAEEVRNLAARSAAAAKETTDMIETSIHKVEGGTKIANDTAEALNKIVDSISNVSELVSEIASASDEQAQGVEQINQGINQISDVVQTTSATAEETAAASEELSSQAELLKEQVATFKLSNQPKSESIDPAVLKAIDDMRGTEGMSSSKPNKISLSDNDFEKY